MTQGTALVDADVNPAATAAPAELAASPMVPARGYDDGELVRRLRQDTPAAFENLVATYQGRLTRLAYRLLGWQADVDDVVQDVLVAVLRHKARFRGDSSLWTWLTAITVNRCRSENRRQRLRRLFFRPDCAEPAAPDVPAWSDAISQETSKRVREAVQALPPRDREVIVLRYFEHLSGPEIADVTRQSVNAVEVRLHRARARLASSLGELHREEQR